MDTTGLLEVNDFNNVIGIVFNNWTGLKLALDHGSGGTPVEAKNKIENLVTNIRNILDNKGDCYDLIDELELILDEQFSTIVEDNSCEEVSSELIELFKLWSENNRNDIINRLNGFKIKESILVPLSRINARPVRRIPVENEEDMDTGDQEMDEDSEWTVVEKKKR